MKRGKLFGLNFFVFACVFACISCQLPLGTSWYKRPLSQGPKNGTQLPNIDNGNEEEAPQPENENTSGYTEVKPFEYFNENYSYPATKFDEWVLYMTDITLTNIASYQFEAVTPWIDKGNGEYEYVGRDGKGKIIGNGQQNKTWDLTYYMYKTRKDRWIESNHFDPNLNAEEAEKQKRFYFYRFTGKTASPTLNNSTFCVDTYSKFLFFYSEPATKNVSFGNTIPSNWKDYEAETDGHHTKRDKKFYEYDPVGFVREDGSVVIYNWVKAKIVASDYSPSMNEKFKYVAKAGKSGEKGSAGHSPYKYEKLKIYSSDAQDDDSSNPTLWIRAKSLKNSTMAGLKWTSAVVTWVSAPDDPRFSYSLKASLSYKKNETPVSKTTELIQKNAGNNSGTANDFHAIKTGTEALFDFSKFFQQEVEPEFQDLTIKLDLQIVKSNRQGTAGLENNRSKAFYLYKFNNPITIVYDKDSKTWKCPAVTDKVVILDGNEQPTVKMSYPAFELKRGKLKDFVITLNSANKKDSSNWDMASEGEIEVTYTIGFN